MTVNWVQYLFIIPRFFCSSFIFYSHYYWFVVFFFCIFSATFFRFFRFVYNSYSCCTLQYPKHKIIIIKKEAHSDSNNNEFAEEKCFHCLFTMTKTTWNCMHLLRKLWRLHPRRYISVSPKKRGESWKKNSLASLTTQMPSERKRRKKKRSK